MGTTTDARTVSVEVEVTLWVSRGGSRGLQASVRDTLEDVALIEELQSVTVDAVQPRANDLQVDVTLRAAVRVDDPNRARGTAVEALTNGFGVTDVTIIDTRSLGE
jgi:acyl-CoA hydrolase